MLHEELWQSCTCSSGDFWLRSVKVSPKACCVCTMFWKWLMSAVASLRMFSYLFLVSLNTSIWASSSRSTVLEPRPNLSENICLVHCTGDTDRDRLKPTNRKRDGVRGGWKHLACVSGHSWRHSTSQSYLFMHVWKNLNTYIFKNISQMSYWNKLNINQKYGILQAQVFKMAVDQSHFPYSVNSKFKCVLILSFNIIIIIIMSTHSTLYVFMPHFLTLSNFSTATPRETSSVELLVLWFEDPKTERIK